MRKFSLALIVGISLVAVVGYAAGKDSIPRGSEKDGSAADERIGLLNSQFGDYRNADIIKESGRVHLEVWKPYVKHVQMRLSNYSFALLRAPLELSVEYDEVWYDNTVPDSRSALYWKKGRVQACTAEKVYVSNPLTGASLSPRAYQTILIFDRRQILKELGGG